VSAIKFWRTHRRAGVTVIRNVICAACYDESDRRSWRFFRRTRAAEQRVTIRTPFLSASRWQGWSGQSRAFPRSSRKPRRPTTSSQAARGNRSGLADVNRRSRQSLFAEMMLSRSASALSCGHEDWPFGLMPSLRRTSAGERGQSSEVFVNAALSCKRRYPAVIRRKPTGRYVASLPGSRLAQQQAKDLE